MKVHLHVHFTLGFLHVKVILTFVFISEVLFGTAFTNCGGLKHFFVGHVSGEGCPDRDAGLDAVVSSCVVRTSLNVVGDARHDVVRQNCPAQVGDASVQRRTV